MRGGSTSSRKFWLPSYSSLKLHQNGSQFYTLGPTLVVLGTLGSVRGCIQDLFSALIFVAISRTEDIRRRHNVQERLSALPSESTQHQCPPTFAGLLPVSSWNTGPQNVTTRERRDPMPLRRASLPDVLQTVSNSRPMLDKCCFSTKCSCAEDPLVLASPRQTLEPEPPRARQETLRTSRKPNDTVQLKPLQLSPGPRMS